MPTFLILLALIASLAIAWTSTTASSADPQSSGTDQRAALTAGSHGYGRTFRGQWFGTWRFGSRTGFCIEFDRAHPNNTSSIKHAPDVLPRFSRAASARAKYVITNYGSTHNGDLAASAAIAVWKLQNTARFNNYYKKMVKAKAIPKAIQHKASAILSESLNHGPYKLSMSMGSGLPGQVFRGSVTVRAANGKAMAGRAVSLTALNARIVTLAGRSNAAGVIPFTVRVASTGQVKVTARLTALSSRGIWITNPTPTAQMIGMPGGVKDTATAFRTTVRSYAGARLANGCDGSCDGAAPIRVSMKTEVGSMPMTQYVYVNGTRVGSMSALGGKTLTKVFTASDAATVTVKSCFTRTLGGACATALVAGPALVAECPPMATFRYEATCDCEAPKAFTFTVVGPKTPTKRSYLAVLEVSGQKTQQLTLTGNGTQTFKQVTAPKGTHVKLTAKVLGKSYVLDELTVG